MRSDISDILMRMQDISLEQMGQVSLMNRIDAKYLMCEGQLPEMLGNLQDDYMVQVLNGSSWQSYHTAYLDDSGHTMYLAHHNGRLVRQKVRVRTYLDSDNLTFFEVKLKNNHGKTKKKRMKVNGMASLLEDGADEFLSKTALLEIPLTDMIPVLENRFERITLVNKAKTERLTIDTALSFHNLETGASRAMENLVIVELKRDGMADSKALDVLRELRVHPSGFSKYCIGSAMTNPELKHGRFNVRIRKVNKIMDTI